MRTLNYFWVATIFILATLFVSCSSKKVGFFSASYPQYAHKQLPEHPLEAAVQLNASPTVIEKYNLAGEMNETGEKNVSSHSKPRRVAKVSQSIAANSEASAVPVKTFSKLEKRELKHIIKKENTNRTGIGTLLLVIIAIILPPLAVLLVDSLNGPFWLDILLTLLFYIPGLIYALWRVFREER